VDEQKATILIVEDEKLTALVIQKKLENLGYKVCGSVMRGIDAVNEATHKKPDIVLMDIQLKGDMDGIQASEIIKNSLAIPVIFVTAYSDKNTIERAKLTTPFGYIIKPVNEKDLVTNIEIALYKHRAERDLQVSQQQLRELTARLQLIREEERTRISREIHDELGQMLTCLKIDATLVNKKLNDDQEELKEKVISVINLIDLTIACVRRISSELRPGILDDLGLIPAIEWQTSEFEKRTGVKCELEFSLDQIPIEPEKSTEIFRIFQETLTNIARHANASNVTICLICHDNMLKLDIADNGKGFSSNGKEEKKSLGILGMKERALLIGGTVTIISESGKGTTVNLSVPIIEI
jgi:signal transduction histidine kinase